MRHEITETEYLEIYSGDLSEKFETFCGQSAYLEVLECNGTGADTIIGTVDYWTNGQFWNASMWFQPIEMPVSSAHPNGYTYASTVAREASELTTTYWRYDTMEDAITHAAELMRDHVIVGI